MAAMKTDPIICFRLEWEVKRHRVLSDPRAVYKQIVTVIIMVLANLQHIS